MKTRPLQVKYFILPLGSLFLALMLYFTSQSTGVQHSENDFTEEQAKIELALAYIGGGKTPMKGILMLRSLKETYPENKEVYWYLGQFSMESGQFQKAEEYLTDFINMLPAEDTLRTNAGKILLSDAIAAQGRHEQAVDLLIEVRKSTKDSVLMNAAQERLMNYLK
jgi:Tfp pilus assembly protein PilF